MAATKPSLRSSADSLQGQILIAMPPPAMADTRFERSVIFICAHADSGAMGLVINKPATHVTFDDLAQQLSLGDGANGVQSALPVHLGGPVETSRGFVLHTSDYIAEDATLEVTDDLALTATVDILREITNGNGPQRSLLALGYAGWGPGQIEAEIKANGWLHGPVDLDLIFAMPDGRKWTAALSGLGVHPSSLSNVQGTA